MLLRSFKTKFALLAVLLSGRVLYGENSSDQYVIRVTDRQGQLLYVSPHWPAAVNVTALDAPMQELADKPELPPSPPEQPEFAPPSLRANGLDRRGLPPALDDRGPEPIPPPHMRLLTPCFVTRTTDHRTWRFANTGPGIPDGERERLFERFYRADKARNQRIDGSGLGLSLAREIARAHNGDLTLDRSDADLTVFRLVLPTYRSQRPR
jgi:hypothetical protein